jgi:hypothetical protein
MADSAYLVTSISRNNTHVTTLSFDTTKMATWVKSYDPAMVNVPYFALQQVPCVHSNQRSQQPASVNQRSQRPATTFTASSNRFKLNDSSVFRSPTTSTSHEVMSTSSVGESPRFSPER